MDFTDDAKKTINSLDNLNGLTKSTRKDGIDIHTGYKKGNGFMADNKEYTKAAGIRPDYYDGTTIFELKPYNPRAAKAGVKQLRKYNSVLGGGKVMRMELY